MSSRRSRTNLRHAFAKPGRFTVVCRRHDGRERMFQSYDYRAHADAVAARLCVIGCPARVVFDELEFERKVS
jgi:hypothetical protein